MFPKLPIIQITTHYRNAVIEKVVGTSSDIFGNVRKSSENRRKCSEIPDMTRRKRHEFDSEIVGSYTIVFPLVQVKSGGIV